MFSFLFNFFFTILQTSKSLRPSYILLQLRSHFLIIFYNPMLYVSEIWSDDSATYDKHM